MKFHKKLISLFFIFFLMCQLSCSLIIKTPFDPPRSKRPNWYRGIYHVHSNYSHDSKATLELISDTAKKTGLDFVVITDHNNISAKDDAAKIKDPLLIVGTELSTWYDGHLGMIGINEMPTEREHSQQIIDWAHQHSGYAIPAHPFSKRKPWKKWDLNRIDGIELFCFSDFFYAETWQLILKVMFYPPDQLLKTTLNVHPEIMKWWDEKLSAGEHIAGFAAADAHLKVNWNKFHIENLLLYFQAVTEYVYAPELNEKNILESLGMGKSFIAFEVFGIAQNFSFTAQDQNRVFGMSEIVPSSTGILKITVPQKSEIKLIHNGKVIETEESDTLEYAIKEGGYYRVEVYLNGKLWILSNPIYFESPKTT